MWNAMGFDWKPTTPENILANLDKGIRRNRRLGHGSNLLLHDGGHASIGQDRTATVAATATLLARAQKPDIRFVTVDAWDADGPAKKLVHSPQLYSSVRTRNFTLSMRFTRMSTTQGETIDATLKVIGRCVSQRHRPQVDATNRKRRPYPILERGGCTSENVQNYSSPSPLSASPCPHLQCPHAQYYPPPQAGRPVLYLGKAHVDGPTDHDDIQVGRYDSRFHSVMLKVRYAPIQFDHVVIHYGDGEAQTLPVKTFIPPGRSSHWIVLPGGERVIRSLERWYARARPEDPNRPEVELYGAP